MIDLDLDLDKRLPEEISRKIEKIKFRELIASNSGIDICKKLINWLIDLEQSFECSMSLGGGDYKRSTVSKSSTSSSTNLSLANRLKYVCPGFFNQSDQIQFIGYEKLRECEVGSMQSSGTSALTISRLSYSEKRQLLIDALVAFSEVAKDIDIDEIVHRFCVLGFYEGAINLLLKRIKDVDPLNLAVAFVSQNSNGLMSNQSAGVGDLMSGDPEDDARLAAEKRYACYQLIIQVLNSLHSMSVVTSSATGAAVAVNFVSVLPSVDFEQYRSDVSLFC